MRAARTEQFSLPDLVATLLAKNRLPDAPGAASARPTGSIKIGRELRALVGDEDSDQFRRRSVARIGRDQMRCPRRFEECLADRERLERTAAELGADFAL